jgi:hypothetical protein
VAHNKALQEKNHPIMVSTAVAVHMAEAVAALQEVWAAGAAILQAVAFCEGFQKTHPFPFQAERNDHGKVVAAFCKANSSNIEIDRQRHRRDR